MTRIDVYGNPSEELQKVLTVCKAVALLSSVLLKVCSNLKSNNSVKRCHIINHDISNSSSK